MAQFNKNTHQYLNQEKTLFEVMMLADQYGNLVGPANPSGMAVDAFGRARTSSPLTLFDSNHRYSDNGLWSTLNASGGTAVFNSAQGLVDLNVTTTSGSSVIRETTKVFAYQPGKSLQILNTFCFNQAKTNLRQRVGYFGESNGFYIELNDSTLSFVKRSSVSGSLVETKISQFGSVYGAGDTGWNVDPMDGTGPSLLTIDPSKSHIFWVDLEWLGVGTVRMGVVINGEFIHCHSFHHANLITTTYITTASLPVRYEITNTGTTASSSTLKQICSTVISEGGYQLNGTQQAVNVPITAARTLANAGTYYPIVALQLKVGRLDSIVIPTNISLMGQGNGIFYHWMLIAESTVTGGTWVDAGANSSVEYNLTGTAVSGGRILASGYTSSSNQGVPTVTINKENLFRFQLERNGLTNTPFTLSLAVASATATQTIFGGMDWEEVTR